MAPALRPTTAGRTLDVSSGGEAGLDWANVGSPTTSLGLTGTTIATTQTIATVTNQLTAAQIATGVWTDTTAGDFTTALSVGKSVMNGVTLGTGLTVNDITTKTGYSLSQSFPSNFSSLGITAGGHITTVDTVTTVTNQLTAAAIATGVWTDTTAGDFTTSLSVGKSVMNGVTLGTGLTVASVSGAVGSVTGLTASNLDATISSRMATYTQPTGFLAATFPSGTVANTTNITSITGNITGSLSGSVGSVTGLTAANLDVAISTRLASAGYTAPDNTSITAIKTKTDQLVFTKTNELDANIQSVNGVTVNGDGGATTWGP